MIKAQVKTQTYDQLHDLRGRISTCVSQLSVCITKCSKIENSDGEEVSETLCEGIQDNINDLLSATTNLEYDVRCIYRDVMGGL